MTSVSQDVRFSLRMLQKHKGFTIVSALTLALGIGVNTAMFSVLNTFLFGSLPYPQSERFVRVWRTSPHSQTGRFSGNFSTSARKYRFEGWRLNYAAYSPHPGKQPRVWSTWQHSGFLPTDGSRTRARSCFKPEELSLVSIM